MTDEQIIELAKQAWSDAGEGWVVDRWFNGRAKAFIGFAKLVAQHEREACAKIVELNADACRSDNVAQMIIKSNAEAIRGRGATFFREDIKKHFGVEMNERIKELYLHAFPPSLNDSTVCRMSAEKFAELIVKECAELAKHHVMNISTYGDAEFVDEQIKEHFGVEE